MPIDIKDLPPKYQEQALRKIIAQDSRRKREIAPSISPVANDRQIYNNRQKSAYKAGDRLIHPTRSKWPANTTTARRSG